MAEPEYPILKELETKLKLLWVDTDDVMATQRAIIQVEPELAYLELPRGRKGDKGDPGPAISIQGIVAADSQLPASAEVGHAYVNTSTKGLAVWNGSSWFKVDNFAGVDADVQQFSQWLAQLESEARRAANAAGAAANAASSAEYWANETIQQVTGDFATRNYVDDAKWDRGFVPNTISTIDEIPDGWSFLTSLDAAQRIGLQEAPVTVSKHVAGGYGIARVISWSDPTRSWVAVKGTNGWGGWQEDSGGTLRLEESWAALDEVPDGVFFVDSTEEQSRLGLPAAHGTLEVRTAKPYGLATFKGWDEAGRTWVSERQTIGWRDWKPERLKLVDASTNSRNVIEVDHYGTGYGLDIQNYPGSNAALVLHNYTGDGKAMIIDNCDNQVAVEINNTINTSITPDNIAKGDFFHLAPWSDIQRKVWRAKLTNDLTLKNDTEHPLSIQRVDEALVGSRAQDDIVLQIKDKAGEVTASIHSDGRVSDRYTRHGEGMPEGNVTAPVGAIYTDTVATNGAIRWVKTSGTGNTGWRVEYGDTGIRNITSLIEGDTGSGVARIQRIGNTVMLAFNNIPTPGDGTYMSVPNFIPVGFRSAFNWQHLGVGKAASIDATGPLRIGTNGDLYIYRTSSETRINGTVTYISDTPWPTTLPGTPA